MIASYASPGLLNMENNQEDASDEVLAGISTLSAQYLSLWKKI